MKDTFEHSEILHERLRGKLATVPKMSIETQEDLALAYTPGVARPCENIAKDPARARALTIKHNSVAVVSDGSAVLGLGNIGALASIPVMEGKAILFKHFADIDAWPLCLDTQDTEEIIQTVRRIAPVFGGINLEDIAAPRCFEIENRLQDLGIPVFHDDQHGTAIVVLAALINAGRVLNRPLTDMRVVISGAGAAGTAIAALLRCVDYDTKACNPVADVIVCDSKGIIHAGRDDLSKEKSNLLAFTNRSQKTGTLQDALEGADVFIGVSKADLLKTEDIRRMAKDSIVLALANPVPEIMPDDAHAGGAAVVATGRSDFPNQINNVMAFPGIFRGALDAEAPQITLEMKMAAAKALANAVEKPEPDKVLPHPMARHVAGVVARAVAEAAKNPSQSA